MNYKKIDDTHILVRLDVADDVVASLMTVAERENIRLASVQGIGAADHVVMGVYNVATREFKANIMDGALEITSILGTLDTMEGEHYSHLHIALGDEEGRAYGGHLKEATISGTAEIMLTILPGEINRAECPKTGLNVWKFA